MNFRCNVLSAAALLLILSGCSDSPTGVVVPPLTPPSPPLLRVTTGSATSVGPTGATLNATVYPRGVQTYYCFEIGTTTSYGTRTSIEDAGARIDSVGVSATVSDLVPGTVYHYRADVMIPTPDTIRGEDRTFSCIVTAPQVSLMAVFGSSTTSVVVEGTVNPMGLSTTYHFEYGATPAYGQSLSQQNAGSGVVPLSVSATIGNLAPSGSYHWRLVAVNSGGTARTSDSTFTTPVDLAFPLAVGTAWTYRYDGHFADPPLFTRDYGTHIWQIVSKSGTPDSMVCSLNDLQNDTVKNYIAGAADTTISLSSHVVPFTIVESSGAITVNFPEALMIVHRISRFVPEGSDTLAADSSNTWAYDVLRYARGVGVVGYSYYHDLIHSTGVDLSLISFSNP